MSAGWWWVMVALCTMTLMFVLYFGVFLIWLHKYGGVKALKAELQNRLGRKDNEN